MDRPAQQYLSAKEAAVLLGVTRRTIYAWIRNGHLEAVRFGHVYRIINKTVLSTVKR